MSYKPYHLILIFTFAVPALADSVDELKADLADDNLVSLTLRDTPFPQVMEMLSQAARVNILLSDDIDSNVSVNLYNVSIEDAIESITAAAGYGVEKRSNSYFIVERSDVGAHNAGGPTELRTFKVQYSEVNVIQSILNNHISEYGKITTLPQRNLLVVEDTPHFLNRIAKLLRALDRKPKQIFIQARILEIGLKSSESYGLDWSDLFNSNGGTGAIGVKGLATPGAPGFFFELVTPDVEVFLDTLKTRDRLQTLSAPKILAMEDQEAEAIIGDRLGYNVTTTIEGVTTTSVEYLESGVILRVKPSVDEQNRILLYIHPEVSIGTVSDDGIPNQSTTEVTTSMLVNSGETVFIGGLIKRSAQKTREGVPILGDLPLVGRLFSNRAVSSVNSELVVLITPYLIDKEKMPLDAGKKDFVDSVATELEGQPEVIEEFFSTKPARNEGAGQLP